MKPGSPVRRARTVSRWRRACLGLLAGVIVAGCGGHQEPDDDIAATDPSFLPVRSEFRMVCAACHGKNGRGASSLFPPLRNSAWASADPAVPIRIVLHGLDGPVSVGGKDYLNRMAPLGDRLDDAKIARILTYVRASWGNSGGPVTPDQVAAVRRETADRKKPWTEPELRQLAGDLSPPDSAAAPAGD